MRLRRYIRIAIDDTLLWFWWHFKEKPRWKQMQKEIYEINREVDRLFEQNPPP